MRIKLMKYKHEIVWIWEYRALNKDWVELQKHRDEVKRYVGEWLTMMMGNLMNELLNIASWNTEIDDSDIFGPVNRKSSE